jgi:hypothetical protein
MLVVVNLLDVTWDVDPSDRVLGSFHLPDGERSARPV